MKTMGDKRKEAQKCARIRRDTIESGFNDFLQLLWENGYNPTSTKYIFPELVAKNLLGNSNIKVHSFIYLSDFGEIDITVVEDIIQ